MIRWLGSDSRNIRGVMWGRFYILFVEDDFKTFVTFGINKI
jgi:hypothetical protein